MVRRIFPILLAPLALAAQTLTLQEATATETQAVIRYVAPDDNACTIQVSTSAAMSPLVHDVDPALFAGSNLDTRAGSTVNGTERVVVVGKRDAEKAADGNRYSRALQAFTQHYYTITCGAQTLNGTFQTANVQLGNNSTDVPPYDPTAFGNYGWPTIDWNNQDTQYIDPFTGLLMKRVTYPGDHGSMVTSGPMTQPDGAQDGSLYYTLGNSCTGYKWQNPCAVLAADGVSAVYSGAGGDPLGVPFTKDGYLLGAALPVMGAFSNFQVSVKGSGTDSQAANRTVMVCLSAHVHTGVCGTGSFPLVLPQGTAGTVTYPASPTPDTLLAAWLDATHTAPISMLHAPARKFGVVVSGTSVTWNYNANGNNPANFFDETWVAGDHITIPGSAPTCPANDCTIASVQNATNLTITENLGNFNAGSPVLATATNFGAILSKSTGIGSVSVDYVSNMQSDENGFSNASSGQTYMFSTQTMQVCVDRNGNPINPCRQAYGFMPPVGDATTIWMLFFPDNGESRVIDFMRPPNVGGVDGYAGVYCGVNGEGFDPSNPGKVYCQGLDSTGTSMAIVSGTYQYNPANGCDYRHWNGYYANPGGNPCVVWKNETPLSTGQGFTAAVQAVWPQYDPLYDGGPSFCSESQNGRYMAFRVEQNAGPNSNPQNTFGNVVIYDIVQHQVVQILNSYNHYPARYGQLHGCGGEYFEGYNSAFMSTYNFTGNPRGTADYTMVINSIQGRSDLSLDPTLLITNISAAAPALVTTASPHQIDANGSTQINIITAVRSIYGTYYAKVQSPTTFQLYQDAGFTKPVSFPYGGAYQQGFNGPGAIGKLTGGTGCTGTSFTVGPINDEGGTGATLTATVKSGSVASVTITNQGSGYGAPVYVPLTGNSCSGASVVLNPEQVYMNTLYANACPAVAAKWQAAPYNVAPGSPNCITLNLAADPVKINNTETLNGGRSGVYRINMVSGGSGYTGSFPVTVSGGGGSGFSGTATVAGGQVTGVTIAAHGSGFNYPRVAFATPACPVCALAKGAVVLSGNAVSAIQLDTPGMYKVAPAVTIYGSGTGAAATAALAAAGEVSDITVTNGGTGYLEIPQVTLSGGGGTGAAAVAVISGGVVTGINVTNSGSGYTSAPLVQISGGYGTGAAATANLAWPVASVTVTSGGSGYSAPAVSFASGGGTGAAGEVGLYEEMTAFPYPHNAANCGGDGTTAHCWSQPLTLQEGDAFGFINENNAGERPFAVQVTHNPDGTVTGTFARFLGPCNTTIPPSTSNWAYNHKTPIRPTMSMGEACATLELIYQQSDTAMANPLTENPLTGMHGDFMTPQNPAKLPVLASNDGFFSKVRIGVPASVIGQPYQWSSPNPMPFAGSAAQTTRGIIQTHPSTRQYAAPLNELGWYLDSRVLSSENGGVNNVFLNKATPVGACSGPVCIYDVTSPFGLDIKRVPLAVWAGNNLFLDKSGPGSALSVPQDVWKYCVSYLAGECVSGSPAGHIYMVVNEAVTNGQCGGYYGFNVPCVLPANADFSNNIQVGYDKRDPTGTYWRRLTMAMAGWARNVDGFTNARATPDGSWAIVIGHWLDGLDPAYLAVKLPPWPTDFSTNQGQFITVPVTVEAIPGVAKARIRFGYGENGAPGSYYCTSRQEACTTSGTPFAYASEAQSDTPCGNGCVIGVPGIPRRVMYYEVDGLNGSGQIVYQSPMYVEVVDEQRQELRRRKLKWPGNRPREAAPAKGEPAKKR